ncbi:hypothetical protein [uncultured Enterovirga sp.]|uniref:hypothetical protein n=1 Tax=uncultured Enterovirga sp. TaxID=2026352 RepID=UPI0035CBCDE6
MNRNIILGGLAALTMGGALVTSSAPAEAHWYGGYGGYGYGGYHRTYYSSYPQYYRHHYKRPFVYRSGFYGGGWRRGYGWGGGRGYGWRRHW